MRESASRNKCAVTGYRSAVFLLTNNIHHPADLGPRIDGKRPYR